MKKNTLYEIETGLRAVSPPPPNQNLWLFTVANLLHVIRSYEDNDVRNISMFWLNSSSESKVRSFKLEGIVSRI